MKSVYLDGILSIMNQLRCLEDSYAVDHQGYYNGETGNTSFIPEHYFFNPNGANRDINPNKILTGILKKVNFPTGGYTELFYDVPSYTYNGQINETLNHSITRSSDGSISQLIQSFTLEEDVDDVTLSAAMDVSDGTKNPSATNNHYVRITGPNSFSRNVFTDNDIVADLTAGTYMVTFSPVQANPDPAGILWLNWTEHLQQTVSETRYRSAVVVEQIKTKESTASSEIIKEFEYISGFYPPIPSYVDNFEIEVETTDGPIKVCSYKLLTSSPVISFGGVSNSIGHGEVIEKLGASGIYGQTRYLFSTGTASLSDSVVQNRSATDPIYSWTGGKLLQQESKEFVSGSTYKNKQTSINTYQMNHDPNVLYPYTEKYSSKNETYIYDIRLTQLSKERLSGLQFTPATFQVEILRNVSAWYHPKVTKVRIYDDTGTEYVESLTEFKYDDPLHIQLTQKVETNSLTSEKRVTTYEYASEQDGTGGRPNYSNMKINNMLTQLYSVMVEDDINGVDLSKTWTEWTYDAAISPGPEWRPRKNWVWNGSGTTAPVTPTSDAINVSEVLKYNNAGNPLEVKTGGDVSSITKFYYGSTGSPLSQAGHNSVSGIYLTGIQKELNGIDGTVCGSNDLCSKAFYDTKGRLIKLEDETGNDIEFTYDALNRLKTTINQNQETVSTINYFNNSNYSTSNPHYVETLTHYDPNNSSNVTKSINFFDGLGRGIQSQTIGDGRAIISGTAYSERSQPVATTRPIDVVDPSGYKTDIFDSNFDATGGGELDAPSAVEAYYDDYVSGLEAEYAYLHNKYEASPSAIAEKTALPGTSHKAGSNNEMEVRHDINTSVTDTFHVDGKIWEERKLIKTINEDPSGNESITYTDGWGRVIISGVNMNPLADDQLIGGTDDLITRYAYDERGNLELVIDPKGLRTTYKYNTLGQLEEKKLPDQDHSNLYCYDDKGRLRFHAAPAQAFHYYGDLIRNYTYTKYDDLDRPIEVGERTGLITFSFECNNERNDFDFPESSVSGHTPFIKYSYDGVNMLSGTNNYEGKLTRVEYKDFNSTNKGYTWYSYNNQGLVEWVVQELPGLGSGQRKRIDYTYDELGRLTKISFQKDLELERFYLWYNYDGLGRLESIETNASNNKGTAQTEVQFSYMADGQVKQMRLGNSVEVVDYTYTVQGWLDMINNNNVYYSADEFGMDLDYNLNGTIDVQKWGQSSIPNPWNVQYKYHYDAAGQLTHADFTNLNSSHSEDNNNGFDVVYEYDENGNIKTLIRNSFGPNAYPHNSLISIVNDPNSNRLLSYGLYPGPIPPTYYTVQYDENGNTIANRFTNAVYDWRNLPILVENGSSDVEYAYDAEGMRVKKELVGGETTYYVRGADGQTIAVYDGSGDLLFLNIVAGSNIIGQVVR
ncbi:MAG: RHS repeat domain-containing protein [Balneola sp.]